jgi:hypothetical protein
MILHTADTHLLNEIGGDADDIPLLFLCADFEQRVYCTTSRLIIRV